MKDPNIIRLVKYGRDNMSKMRPCMALYREEPILLLLSHLSNHRDFTERAKSKKATKE
jgi:hypothetical protein